MPTLANRIKEKLNEKGISAYKLEKKVGLKRSAINNILYGKSKSPGIEIIQSIAKGLDCSVSELLGDTSFDLPSSHVLSSKIETIYETPENLPLYCLTLQTIGSLLQQRQYPLTREQIFNCVEEVYNYSLKAHREEVDLYFAEWMINKFQTHS